MYRLFFVFPITLFFLTGCTEVPSRYLGTFEDDYGAEYSISKDLWIQKPDMKYHIIEWNKKEGYIIAKNDKNNPSAMELYTRIDLVDLKKMKPYKWGFCYTMYNGESEQVARNSDTSDKAHPKTGCNGYPFSRMKKKKLPFY